MSAKATRNDDGGQKKLLGLRNVRNVRACRCVTLQGRSMPREGWWEPPRGPGRGSTGHRSRSLGETLTNVKILGSNQTSQSITNPQFLNRSSEWTF